MEDNKNIKMPPKRRMGPPGRGMAPVEKAKDFKGSFKKLLACGQKMMRETHTEAIVLGCLSFLGLAEPLSRVLGIPVIDPAVAAVTTAESIVRQRLFTSKVSYPLLCSKAREIIREI